MPNGGWAYNKYMSATLLLEGYYYYYIPLDVDPPPLLSRAFRAASF
jgi:hypothetical protein